MFEMPIVSCVVGAIGDTCHQLMDLIGIHVI